MVQRAIPRKTRNKNAKKYKYLPVNWKCRCRNSNDRFYNLDNYGVVLLLNTPVPFRAPIFSREKFISPTREQLYSPCSVRKILKTIDLSKFFAED
jgi:hypothetical protein